MNIRTLLKLSNPHSFRTSVSWDWHHFLGQNSERLALVSQIVYIWDNISDRKAFVKFFGKAEKTEDYRRGQSWQELFGWTESKFLTALYGTKGDGGRSGGVATRIQQPEAEELGFSNPKQAIKHLLRTSDDLQHLILVTSDYKNRTWHVLNERLLSKLIIEHNDRMSKIYEAEEEEEAKYGDPVDQVFADYDSLNADEEESLEDFLNAPTPPKKEYRKPEPRQPQGWDRNAKQMHPNFALLPTTIKQALDLGYDKEELQDVIRRFYFGYKTGNYKNRKSSDWDGKFLNEWLPNSFGFGQIKRNGQYKSTTETSSFGQAVANTIGMFDSND